ncbi:MAG: hypothetical protein LAT64_04870 [Phycisphaerales bacterium]|nr:hypothetical protein [Planctomycetota bacterium]MCH8508087.1 hypothetical protein [Phycisphaerales bacterium]
MFPLRTAFAQAARADQRLSTGLRINRGADDPAGLIASEKLGARGASLGAQITAMERASMAIDARDGALGALGRMGDDLAGLVVAAANRGGMGAGELDAVRGQIGAIVRAIDTAASSASFNGSRTLEGFDAGSLGRTEIGTDPDTGEPVLASVRDLERLVVDNPEAAQMVARQAASDIAFARGADGARQRGLESERRAAETEAINTARARSSIRDADSARETAERTRAGLMVEVGIRVALLGRSSRAGVLALLPSGIDARA